MNKKKECCINGGWLFFSRIVRRLSCSSPYRDKEEGFLPFAEIVSMRPRIEHGPLGPQAAAYNEKLLPIVGLEPTTLGFVARYSTD